MKYGKKIYGLRPFFTRFGAKWRSVRRYPAPLHGNIIEPFAGAAGYSTVHGVHRDVLLHDVDPQIAAIWQYLLAVTKEELLHLPLQVDDARQAGVCDGARWLIGFWLNKGTESPSNLRTRWSKLRPDSTWGSIIRSRLVNQVDRVRHWRFEHASYRNCPDVHATWFIDPPYQTVGGYPCSEIDYNDLADFCLSRKGQVIVCENAEADWLQFVPLYVNQGKVRSTLEMVYYVKDAQ